ncbi:MAG: bestrophin family ion channel [Cytophagales bacterium]|nr:bestrophin family ion channel [Cytophagales bacterium]
MKLSAIILWVTLVTALYYFKIISWLIIPWLPMSILGTAVAFYIGFKNNSAYDRTWEARKIWGAIVNASRTWGVSIIGFVGNQFRENHFESSELNEYHKRLIYRHIGWLYVLRKQLLIPTTWEGLGQSGRARRIADARKKSFGTGLFETQISNTEMSRYLSKEDLKKIDHSANGATQLINLQSIALSQLRKEDLIDDFRHMQLQELLQELLNCQGKAERIKKFPLPRQYSSTSLLLTFIFIILLPFGMASEFIKLGDLSMILSVPFTILVCWVFVVMELVGDTTENPFQGLGNDIPMLSLCRTIEIDLLQALEDNEIPSPITEVNGILM